MNRLLVLVVAVAISQASLSHAADAPAPVATPDITGCWSGYWISCTNGHTGPVSATICKINDTCYQAHFKGKFFKVIPFRYNAMLTVTGQEGDKLLLTSSRRLGLLGSFDMAATVNATDFNAEYTSKDDRGRFVMTRP